MPATMNKDLFQWVDWMVREREKQDLSQADLARKTGLTRTAISDYEKRQRANPSIKALVKISVALGYPPEHLPRLAGLLPPEPSKDTTFNRIETLYQTLDEPSSKDRALEYLEFLTQQEKKDDRKRKKPK